MARRAELPPRTTLMRSLANGHAQTRHASRRPSSARRVQVYSVPSWNDLASQPPPLDRCASHDAAQYYRVVQNVTGCPEGYAPWCVRFWKGPYGGCGSDNSVARFHSRAYGSHSYDVAFVDSGAFSAPLFNASEWVALFAAAGARYVRPVVKFGDGFTHWPSNTTSPGWAAPTRGPMRDVVGEIFEAARRHGLRVGVHFEMGEWLEARILRRVLPDGRAIWLEEPERYRDEVLWTQLTELIETYEPDDVYLDSEWDFHSDWWRSREWLAWLFNDSPVADRVTINDRWGNDTRGHHGSYFVSEYGKLDFDVTSGHAWTSTKSINSRFGYNRFDKAADLQTAEDVLLAIIAGASQGGNVDLSVDAMGDGRIAPSHQAVLAGVGEWMAQNGEAIYSTRRYAMRQNATSSAGTLVYYTAGLQQRLRHADARQRQKPAVSPPPAVFLITTQWPGLTLTVPMASRPASIIFLGAAAGESPPQWRYEQGDGEVESEGTLTIDVPPPSAGALPRGTAATFLAYKAAF